MMTVERVTVKSVQEMMKDFFEKLLDDGEDVVEFDTELITQSMINEMNEEIDGFDHTKGSASSYVPKTVWDVLEDEDLVDTSYEDKFITWFEATYS